MPGTKTIKQPLAKTVGNAFDEAYNLALDHAISIAEQHALPAHPSTLLNSIIRQLKNLKSNDKQL